MAFRDPNSPTTPTAVRELLDGMKSGEIRVSTVPVTDQKAVNAIGASVLYISTKPKEFSVSKTQGDFVAIRKN